MSSKRCFSTDGNSPYCPNPALLMSRSISIPFSFVNAKIFSGATGFAKSAAKTSVFTLCFARNVFASSSSRSLRRAVRTSFVPPAANSSASATPIPALAPVMSAHLPNQFADICGMRCDKVPSRKMFSYSSSRRTASLFLGAREAIRQASAFVFEAIHQPSRPHKFRGEQTQAEKNHHDSGPRGDQHDATGQKQGKSSDDEKDSANLLNCTKDHECLGKGLSGGEGGIRTHGTVSRTLAFEASAFNRSATSPRSFDNLF